MESDAPVQPAHIKRIHIQVDSTPAKEASAEKQPKPTETESAPSLLSASPSHSPRDRRKELKRKFWARPSHPSNSNTRPNNTNADDTKFLTVSDFLPISELQRIVPQAKPAKFIRQSWVEEQSAIVLKHFASGAGESVDTRVRPMALVGHSCSGKTRAMLELAKSLQLAGHPVIYIEFNTATPLVRSETEDPVCAVVNRIAYAIATPTALSGRSFLNRTTHKPRFQTTMEEISIWLGSRPCILCIDELNRLIPPEQEGSQAMRDLATFLKRKFLDLSGRYLIFTSHVLATTEKLISFMSSPSDRVVIIPALPLFESAGDAELVVEDKNARHPAFYGNSPGLSYVAGIDVAYPAKRVRDCLSYLRVFPLASRVIKNIFSGDCNELRELDTICHFSGHIRVWIPAFLIPLLKALKGLEKSDQDNAVNLLSLLGTSKLFSGECWEVVVLCTLFFRLLNWSLSSVECDSVIFPSNLPEKFKLEVKRPSKRDADKLIEDLRALRIGIEKEAKVIISYPKHASFELYDIILAVFRPGEVAEIWGYQCKAGNLPTDPPILPGTSIVLRCHDMDASLGSKAVDLGWHVAQQSERNSLLGPTFLPLRLMERRSRLIRKHYPCSAI